MTLQKNFRFNHRHLGLTYAQATGLTKLEVEDYFKNWALATPSGKKVIVEKYLIALEHHKATAEDPIGGIHFHVYLKFNVTLRTRNTKLFDIEDIMGATYHPHFDRVRGIRNIIEYLTKEDPNPFSNFDYEKEMVGEEAKPDFDQILTISFNSPEEFLEYMVTTYPKYTFSKYTNIRALAYDRYKPIAKEYVPKFTLFPNVPFAADAWVKNYLIGKIADRSPSLLMIGGTGTGKTEWSRALAWIYPELEGKEHMYFNGGFNLEIWNENAEYIVIDDFDSDPDVPLEKYFRSWKMFFGCQKEFTLTDKYCRKKRVHWGKPMIFICNEELNCKNTTIDYIKKNSVRINVHSSFY